MTSGRQGHGQGDARELLGLNRGVDDAGLLGVTHGSSRDQIIAAARARLTQLARNPAIPAVVREAARIEIRDAARRLVAMLEVPSQSPVTDSLAAAVFMRRDPRRARMFYARMVERDLASRRRGDDLPAAATSARSSVAVQEDFDLEFDISGEPARRVPWVLGVFVVLSVILLVAEIIYLRSAPDATSGAVDRPRSESEAPPADPVQSNSEFQRSNGVEIPKRPERAPPETSRATQEPIASEAGAISSTERSEVNRTLRDRWQRMARAAVEAHVADDDAAPTTDAQHDPLAIPLGQVILLERMTALDLAARQLLDGDDEAATVLLDTLPSDSTVTIPPRPIIELAISPDRDGELEKSLQRSPGATEARASRLRTMRSRAESPGPLDARTLVHEALKGPSRTTRTIAQAILVDRGRDSRAVLEAIEERFTEIANDPSLGGMIRACTGVDPTGPEGFAAARVALLDRILQHAGSRQAQVDRACEELAATLRTVARQRGVTMTTTTIGASEIMGALATASVEAVRSDDVHSFVKAGTHLLHHEALALKARRPADASEIDRAVVTSSIERDQAGSALDQAIANARGLLELDAIRLTVSALRSPPVRSTSPSNRSDWSAVTESQLAAQWKPRLESLSREDAEPYFVLAEDVAAHSDSPQSLELARQLFALAGAIEPSRFAASAALALESMSTKASSESDRSAARWRAVAQEWSEYPLETGHEGSAASIGSTAVGSAVRGAAVDAIVQYRRGFGRRAIDRLKQPRVRALFESVMRSVPGGSEEFDRLAPLHVRGEATPLDPHVVDALLRVEQALLQPRSARWSVAIALAGNEPVVDAPLGTPSEVFGVDPQRTRWRVDRWVTEADSK